MWLWYEYFSSFVRSNFRIDFSHCRLQPESEISKVLESYFFRKFTKRFNKFGKFLNFLQFPKILSDFHIFSFIFLNFSGIVQNILEKARTYKKAFEILENLKKS